MGGRRMAEALKSLSSAPEAADEPKLVGLLAEFEDVDTLVAACRALREAGFRRWDSYSPFPVHGIDRAMGIRRTILPLLVFGAGATGTTIGFLMQAWMNGFDYKYIVSGKPFISFPQHIPIMFELTVLFAALTAFGGMLALNGLPRLYDPLLKSRRFKRVTTDGFFISVDSSDAMFHGETTRERLLALGSTAVEEVWDEE